MVPRAPMPRTLDLKELVLHTGSHEPNHTFCMMEAVAYIAGEPWSDHPACASPVLGAFCRSWNDALDDETRQRLKPYIPRLVDTKATKDVEKKRAWMATDWLARECAPAFLRLAGLTEHAETLEGLVALTGSREAKAAKRPLAAANAARYAATGAVADVANSARYAATYAAWDAMKAAANAARYAATGALADVANSVRYAATYAAWDTMTDAANAARYAATGAATDAAWDTMKAAADALAPTAKVLQESSFLLLDRMIETKNPGGA